MNILLGRAVWRTQTRELLQKSDLVNNLKIKSRIFGKLKENTVKRKAEKTICEKIGNQHEIKLIKITIKTWANKTKNLITKRKQNEISEKFNRKNRLVKNWKKWHAEFSIKRTEFEKLRKVENFNDRELMKKTIIGLHNNTVNKNWKKTYFYYKLMNNKKSKRYGV